MQKTWQQLSQIPVLAGLCSRGEVYERPWKGKRNPVHTDAYYEEQASLGELYLEEVEEDCVRF
jgi:hypothetical protein